MGCKCAGGAITLGRREGYESVICDAGLLARCQLALHDMRHAAARLRAPASARIDDTGRSLTVSAAT